LTSTHGEVYSWLFSDTSGASNMYTLSVEGMSCGHCVASVTKSILAIDSQAKVHVDLAAKKVEVDSSAGLNAITAAITSGGYSVVNAA
jgi:copper chaperone CopZ